LRTLYACFNSLQGPVPSVSCHAHIHDDKANGNYEKPHNSAVWRTWVSNWIEQKDAHCIPCRHRHHHHWVCVASPGKIQTKYIGVLEHLYLLESTWGIIIICICSRLQHQYHEHQPQKDHLPLLLVLIHHEVCSSQSHSQQQQQPQPICHNHSRTYHQELSQRRRWTWQQTGLRWQQEALCSVSYRNYS